jgi:sRNA-binding regulator protein Hfq
MGIRAILPLVRTAGSLGSGQLEPRFRRNAPGLAPLRLTSHDLAEDVSSHQAELFYLQKQIQTQTPMVIVLEDGEHIEGNIEWYDLHSLKVRGRVKCLIYKSAIKYMYKLGDAGPVV